MNLPAFIFAEPLAFHGPSLAAWCQRRQEMASMAISEKQGWEFYFNQRRPMQASEDGIAVIHVHDVLGNNLAPIDKQTGMTDYADFIAEVEKASADPAVKGILLDINSPGGSAVGAPEAAAAVAAVEKPVVALVSTLGASAAYYIASSANAIVASPSAIVGSIGTIATFLEFSGMLAQMGITANIFTPEKSDLKATGNPMRPMTAAERSFMQSRIESMNANFTGWVKSRRPAAQDSAMRGQWMTGSEAQAAGLVDVVGGKTEALALLR